MLGCWAVLALVTACSSLECPMNNTVYTTYALYKSDGTRDTLKDTLSVFTLQRDDKQDPVLINRDINFSSLTVPISYEGPLDELYFLRNVSITTRDTLYAGTDSMKVNSTKQKLALVDTVIVHKTDRKHFESVECTPSFFHTLTGVECTHHGIDSVVINHPDVNYDSTKEHLHIYFKSYR